MSNHAWCRDPSRDEAVRAAEDGREESLPTLAQAISRAGQFVPSEPPQGAKCTERDSVMERRPVEPGGVGNVTPFAEDAKCSPAVSETGEAQSGMRTERITLEITHFDDNDGDSVCRWNWAEMMAEQGLGINESVRVVEEAMEVAYGQAVIDRLKDERDAAIRERDAAKARLSLRLAGIDVIWSRLLAVGGERDSWKILAEESNARADSLTARVAELEEAAKAAPAANADAQSNHAASAASGAAGTEPVAYFVKWADKDWGVQDQTFRTLERAQDYIKDEKSEDENPQIVPLFASPPPARGWLTEEERRLIERLKESARSFPPSMHYFENITIREALVMFDAILARSSPPEVVLPEIIAETWAFGKVVRVQDVVAALAAAGVAVKEVGCE